MTIPNDLLAIKGGKKLIQKSFKRYSPIGSTEVEAAKAVVESGVLSQYLGSWHEDFYGGPKVREFEKNCAEYFGVKYAITVNSWTSGLIAAVGALGIEPGDEVIVPTWTMCATATAVLHWGGIPIFADIDPDTFTIDVKSVESNISSHTKAIISVDIFGQSADMSALVKLAKKYNLKIISDTAQAPGTQYHGRITGTLADIGGYSLNYHKHIHTGEGGILVTDSPELAEKMQLIRNHAEAVVGPMGVSNIVNMVGYNFRLGEIECAIGIEQLKKLKRNVEIKANIAVELNRVLSGLDGLRLPIVREGCTHAYYIYPIVIDFRKLNVSREKIAQALLAEGLDALIQGYANIHMLPIFQEKIAFGSKGFPWSYEHSRKGIGYEKGICPVAEELHEKSFLGILTCMYDFTNEDIELIGRAFHKVWPQLEIL
uniref:DegT/DnrJ/EryC1/StrS family aminotransferase n=1 Tax=Polynucleobacter sp. TaxID=2029855 RepID=UPI004048AB46